ncbi:permease prefix domain 1-containing protein [Salibacterium aidingense]|uniref:permease prefix domain 1-containing protein n=1 Tax=Salibacterium aidingense TaxID=384933 RepID=UPI000420E655|nr:permease prefix domain 1-containing protein [Salibacterium aidingense]
MRQIDTYVEQVFQQRNKDKQEILDLQNEMKNHLYESAEDIKRKGFSQEEAEELAIQRFGGDTVIPRILDEVSKQQKSFANKLLYAGIVILFLSIVGGFGLSNYSEHMVMEQSRIASNVMNIIIDEHKEISDEVEWQIHQEIDSPYLQELSVYHVNEEPIDDAVSKKVVETEPRFSFSQEPSGIGSVFLRGGITAQQNMNWKIETDINTFYELSALIFYTGILLYWILFFLWGIIHVHHKNASAWRWGTIIFLFNVVGFLIFRWFHPSSGEKENSKHRIIMLS